jgi:hypothetical protein
MIFPLKLVLCYLPRKTFLEYQLSTTHSSFTINPLSQFTGIHPPVAYLSSSRSLCLTKHNMYLLLTSFHVICSSFSSCACFSNVTISKQLPAQSPNPGLGNLLELMSMSSKFWRETGARPPLLADRGRKFFRISLSELINSLLLKFLNSHV